mgnify:CR=1 FL=1
MRNPTARVDVAEIALQTDLSEYDVKEALLFWADAGILLSRESPKQTEDKKVVKRFLSYKLFVVSKTIEISKKCVRFFL